MVVYFLSSFFNVYSVVFGFVNASSGHYLPWSHTIGSRLCVCVLSDQQQQCSAFSGPLDPHVRSRLCISSYRTFMRPRYKTTYKMVTEMEWKCCHGYSGEDCNVGPVGGSGTQLSTTRPRPRPGQGGTGTGQGGGDSGGWMAHKQTHTHAHTYRDTHGHMHTWTQAHAQKNTLTFCFDIIHVIK